MTYELCLSLSMGYANSGRQAIEVGMVNYPWPTFTLIAAIAFGKQRATMLVIPGLVLSIVGIGWVVDGDQGLDVFGMFANVSLAARTPGISRQTLYRKMQDRFDD